MDRNISLEKDIFQHIPLEQQLEIQKCFKYKTSIKRPLLLLNQMNS